MDIFNSMYIKKEDGSNWCTDLDTCKYIFFVYNFCPSNDSDDDNDSDGDDDDNDDDDDDNDNYDDEDDDEGDDDDDDDDDWNESGDCKISGTNNNTVE